MKISEVIKKLEAIKSEEGDLKVVVENGLDPSDRDPLENFEILEVDLHTESSIGSIGERFVYLTP